MANPGVRARPTTTVKLDPPLARGGGCLWDTGCRGAVTALLNGLPYCGRHGAAGLRAIAGVRT